MEETSKQKSSGTGSILGFLSFLSHITPKQKLLSAIIGGIILLLALNSLFSLWDRFTGAIMSFIRPPELAVVDLSNTITNAVVSRGMLVTSESHQTNRDIHITVSRWVMNTGGYSASHFAEGTIFAGVDLESKLVKVTQIDDNHYQMMLPPAEITSCSFKPLTQYDRSTTAFGDWEAVLDLASHMAVNEFVSNALKSDLLNDAENGARRVVGDLIHSVVGDDVTVDIEFHTTQTPKIDDTCVAQEPREWVYDAEDASWSRK